MRWSTFALVSSALLCGSLGCAPDPSDDGAETREVSVNSGLPSAVFAGVDERGAFTDIALEEFRDPDGGSLVITVSGGLWCGTCQWLLNRDVFTSEVARVDFIVGDRDNAPADASAARRWWEQIDGARHIVAADPAFRFQLLQGDAPAVLPLVVVVDRATMGVTHVFSNPSPDAVRDRLELAAEHARQPLVDDLFAAHEWSLLQQTGVPGAPPPDPSNAVADAPAAASLGEALFFDAGLSPGGDVACATCHQPDRQLADALPLARGQQEGRRRTPRIALAAHGRWQTWDGRADSLWAQALGPLESPAEHDSSRTFVAHRVLTHHRAAYARAFPMATLPARASWPASGKPGDADFDALPDAERAAITAVFVNVGKAIAAYERTWRVAPNPLDRYLAGDLDALNAKQKYGLQLFVRTGCMQCHWGPRLTDDAFHDIGMTTGDAGREGGLVAWRESAFRRDGVWSDAAEVDAMPDARDPNALRGQFKTPALRGVAEASFLGHDGSVSDLGRMMELYGWEPEDANTREPWLVPFGETAQWGLLPLLEVLTADPKL